MNTIEKDYQEFLAQKREWVLARITAIRALHSYEKCDTKIKDPERDLWYDTKTKKIYLDKNGYPGEEVK